MSTDSSDEYAIFHEIMEACDADGNNQIDFEEFVQSTIKSRVFSKENIDSVFNSLDINKDGVISREELKKAFSSNQ